MAETVWHNSNAIGEMAAESSEDEVQPIDSAVKFPEWLERGVKHALARRRSLSARHAVADEGAGTSCSPPGLRNQPGAASTR
jgi:hypothetical protein